MSDATRVPAYDASSVRSPASSSSGGLATAVSLVGFNALVHGTLIGAAPMHEEPIAAYVFLDAQPLPGPGNA